MYDWQPIFVFAKLFSNCPETPKSHNFTSPFLLISTFVGLTSTGGTGQLNRHVGGQQTYLGA
jgi:hypothetical protein